MPKKSELKCYFGCAVDGPLHRFPKWEYPHEERFNSWKAALNLLTLEKGNEFIYNNVRLCYRHFEDYYQLPSHRLTGNAIPTLNLTTNLQHQLDVQIVCDMPSTSQQTPSSSQVEIQPTLKKQSAHTHYARTDKQIDILRKKILMLRNKCQSQAARIRMAQKVSKSRTGVVVNRILKGKLSTFDERDEIKKQA